MAITKFEIITYLVSLFLCAAFASIEIRKAIKSGEPILVKSLLMAILLSTVPVANTIVAGIMIWAKIPFSTLYDQIKKLLNKRVF